jgi:hypothetical protein
MASEEFLSNVSLPLVLQQGAYTIQQMSNGRFVDAHEHTVTRTAQNNDTQRWLIKSL